MCRQQAEAVASPAPMSRPTTHHWPVSTQRQCCQLTSAARPLETGDTAAAGDIGDIGDHGEASEDTVAECGGLVWRQNSDMELLHLAVLPSLLGLGELDISRTQ